MSRKQINWRAAQHTAALHDSREAWWYGMPNSIVVVCEKEVRGVVVTTQCKINRTHIERWLKEVKPKRRKRP